MDPDGRRSSEAAGMTRKRLLARGLRAGLILIGATLDPAVLDVADAHAAGVADAGSIQHFVSRPDLRPPLITVTHPAQETAPGYLFIAPSSGPGRRGAMIFDNEGKLVWFHQTTGPTIMDFKVGVYKGEPVLIWWEGKSDNKGLGRGVWVIMDSSYRELARFKPGNGRDADLHEIILTPQGTALVTSYDVIRRDLASVGRSSAGRVVDSLVQELEIPSGRVLWEWRSLDHVGLDESYAKVGPRYDYFHLNSIDLDDAGELLISARNTWAVYKVSRRTGDVLWRLGGKKSDFQMGTGTGFAWQHDARIHDGGRRISIFDDGAAPQVQPQSKGLVLDLDTRRMRATLVQKYTHHPGRLITAFMGNVQLLPNGDALVGWGSSPYLTEFSADGAIRFDAKLPKGGQNYRAYRFPWVGRPDGAPSVSSVGRTVYTSWNGATELASWELLEGVDASRLQATATVPRDAFETALTVTAASTRSVAVVARDAGGAELGRSRTISLG